MAGTTRNSSDAPILTTEAQLEAVLQTILGGDAVKAWHQSKTIWFSVLTVVLGAATVFGYIPEPSPEVSGGLVTIIGAVFAVLRVVTSGAIE